MYDLNNKPPQEAWQELLCDLDGIYAARVVFSKDEVPEEIHVLASETKSAKALTRDIQSALMAAFGASVDYRIISIAQVAPKMIEKRVRLGYAGIETRSSNGSGEISVFLTWGEDRKEGTAPYSSRHSFSRVRGVALATIDAVNKYISGNCQLELLTAEQVEVGGRAAIIAAICDEQGKQLLGSAFVLEDNDNAVVRAVLDALNRKISCFLVA